MTQEWIDQYNKKCAKFLGWKETTDQFKIEWTGCRTKERLDRINKQYIPILEKNGDVLFPDFSVMDFTEDWNWIMEVVDKIERLDKVEDPIYRFTISENMVKIDTSNDEIVWTRDKTKKDATIIAIDKFIELYNHTRIN